MMARLRTLHLPLVFPQHIAIRVRAQFLLINGCEEIVSAIQVAAGQTLSPSDQLQELLVQLVREVPSMRLVMTSRVEALGYKSECCFQPPYKSNHSYFGSGISVITASSPSYKSDHEFLARLTFRYLAAI